MHEFHLKMTKIVLVITALALIFGLLGSISLLRNNYYMRSKYFGLQFDYLKENISFKYSSQGSLLQWIESWRGAPNTKPAKQVAAQSIPILLYHGVITAPGWKSDGTNISLSVFQDQMFALKKAGYQSVTLAQFLDFMQSGKPLPQKSVLITFDDGRADSFYPVDPILRVLNFNAVMFVITGRSFGSDNSKNTFHLSEDELKKMLGSGRWEMASHTQNGHGFMNIDSRGTQGHFLTDKLWLDGEKRLETDEEYAQRVNADLIASKRNLEKNLGIKVLGFAYPFGDYGNDAQNFPGAKPILNDSVNSLFPLAFRQTSGNEFPNNYPGQDFRLVKRIDVNENMSKDQLLSELNSGQEKLLPYVDSFSGNNGWITAWGNSELKSGLLLTRSSVTENSSMTFLNGTFPWTDYTMSANARLLHGNSFAAVARYANGNNYVSCDFTGWGVALSQSIAGVETAISESDESLQISPDQNMEVSIGVSGNTAACYIGSKKIVAGNISPSLNHGGIGFKTWDNSVNNSSLLVSNLKVDPNP
jgi:peptidoglycan/xylan/chitin deacetylase (PgdA/CDA1 family)